jgi:hypothetical protein
MWLKLSVFPWELFMFRLLTLMLPLSDFGSTMRSMLMAAALAVALTAGVSSPPAQAAGCLKGAVVGGVAGHLAGKHGALGAGAGCVVGHHEATKHSREQQTQSAGSGNSTAPGNSGGNGTSR